MADDARTSILFICNQNSIRSPMAAALAAHLSAGTLSVDSAGVYEGGQDPFIKMILSEIGVELREENPKAMNDLNIDRFDVVIALTPEAAGEARRLVGSDKVKFWDVENPTDTRGTGDELMEAYRRAREDLAARIRADFLSGNEKP
ncbi:MAG: low molecular weight phosphatase family protein [Pseudomonadota bacterium]